MSDHGLGARPGALVVDLLGDVNRIGGRALRVKALVALGERLGVPGPTMRVTLARLRQRGWFEVTREGRESVYRLTPECARSLAEGGRRIFRPEPVPWSGEWSMVVYAVRESDRQTREELRRQLVWQGFGLLAPTTWICAHPRLDEIANAAAALPSARLTCLTTRTSGIAADRDLVTRCWDLTSLGAEYAAFVTSLRLRLPHFQRDDLDDLTALVERIALVHEFRRLVTVDPDLPPELQPAGWAGDEAHRLFRRAHDALARTAPELYAAALA